MVSFRSIVFQLATLATLWSNIESAKILVVFPMPSHSHFTLGVTLADALVAKGHEVTMINPYPDKTQPKIRDVSVENIIPFVEEMKKGLFGMDKQNMVSALRLFMTMGREITRMLFENPNVKKLLNSKDQFDVIIIESFINDATIGFGYHFKAPVILLSPSDISVAGHCVANPTPSSYVPSKLGDFTPHMDFWKRLQNFIGNVMFDVIREVFLVGAQAELFAEFITKDVPFDDVAYNISLILTNSHISVTNPIPHQPNVIEIGGYHVTTPKQLPNDLQQFMDNAKEGVVLFSMGSNLKSADLKPETRAAILKAFSKIKQQVLWKFEENIENLPKNVKIMKWLPQNDILAHPNLRAFISHGGLLSTIETVYHGVPVIGIPVFGDQKNNIANAVNNGYALSVPLCDINEENLSKALNDILNNPKYRENVRRRSRLMHDRPLKPIDTAVYWVEYVIRNQGVPEFRSSALDLKWYQLYMIDVILFLTAITVIVFVIFYVIIRKLLGFCLGRKSKNAQKPNKKKNKKE